jgi:hypothetical protein
MSYTPDNQLLEAPLLEVVDALEKLELPIRERMKNPNEWNDDHLKELNELLVDVIDFGFRLRALASEVR